MGSSGAPEPAEQSELAAAGPLADPGFRSLWQGSASLVSILSVAVGAVSVLGYTFSIGYLSYVGPRLTGMLSLTDLLFMVVNAIGHYLILLLILLGVAAAQKAQGDWAAHDLRDTKDDWFGRFLKGALLTITVSLPIMFAAYCSFLSWSVPAGVRAPFLAEWGIALLLPMMVPTMQILGKRTLTPDMPTFTTALTMCVVASLVGVTYGLGNLHAYWDSTEPAIARGLPCVFLKERPRCYDGLFVGSDAALIRVDRRIVAVPRDDVRSVQSR